MGSTRRGASASRTPPAAPAKRPASAPKRTRGAAASGGGAAENLRNGLDEDGILLAFKNAQLEHELRERAIIGKAVESPAEVLLVTALDRALPMPLRIAAAKDAAPYYNRRMPIGVDGGLGKDGEPLPLFDPSRLSTEELTALHTILAKAGVDAPGAAAAAPPGGAVR